jgi:hypothetical protein
MSKTWVTAVALVGGMGAAAAQVYVEGALGSSATRMPCDDFTDLSDATGVTFSCQEQDIGAKLLVGYTLSPWLSVEAGYVDFGRGEVSPDEDIHAYFRVRNRSAYVGGRLLLPLTDLSPQLSAVVRAGFGQVKTRVKSKVEEDVQAFVFRGEIRQVQPQLGLALQWAVDPRLSLVAGGDVTWMASKARPGRPLSLLSFGANYTLDGTARPIGSAAQSLPARPVNYMMLQSGVVYSDAFAPYRNDNAGTLTFGNRPMGLRLAVGRQYGPIWSMELGLTHYGEETVRTKAGVTPVEDVAVSPLGLSALSAWRMPTDMGLNWVTRLGVSYNLTKVYVLDQDPSTTRKLAPMFGLGLEYIVDKDWRVMFTADATRARVGDRLPMVKMFALGAGTRF